ncbi:hypothetical protein, partial [Streptomyces lydicus]|uniref:hypothetical protein n=1 Tax=Streptomyces lydicus TaxID=47763 RepID=UPI0036FD7F68
SGRFPSVLRFRLYQILAVPISPVRFGLSASSQFRLYQIRFLAVSGSHSVRFSVGGGLPFG